MKKVEIQAKRVEKKVQAKKPAPVIIDNNLSNDNFDEIVNDIEKNNNIASLSYVNKELTDIIKWKWILFFLLHFYCGQ